MTHVETFLKSKKMLPLSDQYIYSVLMFVVNNRNLFLDNAELYTIKTRNSYNLHPLYPIQPNTKKEYIMRILGSSVICQLP